MSRENAPRPFRRDAGFTLIEVVVALAILSLSMAALYECFGGASARALNVHRKQLAWLTAESLLSEVRGKGFIDSQERTGTGDDGVSWTLSARPYLASTDSEYVGVLPYEVFVTVRWGLKAGQSIELKSIEWGRTRE